MGMTDKVALAEVSFCCTAQFLHHSTASSAQLACNKASGASPTRCRASIPEFSEATRRAGGRHRHPLGPGVVRVEGEGLVKAPLNRIVVIFAPERRTWHTFGMRDGLLADLPIALWRCRTGRRFAQASEQLGQFECARLQAGGRLIRRRSRASRLPHDMHHD